MLYNTVSSFLPWLREVSFRSLSLAFFFDFAWTRIYVPFLFLPNAKPKNRIFGLNIRWPLGSFRYLPWALISSQDTPYLFQAIFLPLEYSLLKVIYHLHIGLPLLLCPRTPYQICQDRYRSFPKKNFFPSVLWPLLTSCSSLLLQFTLPARPPRVSVITFTSYICYIYTLKLVQYRTLFCLANSSISKCLICSFCSSDQGFARRNSCKFPHLTSFRLRLTTDALVFN